MQLSAIGLTTRRSSTPRPCCSISSLEQTSRRWRAEFRARGVAWRPHAKAFKCPAIAHQLRKAGAIGVTVAKVSRGRGDGRRRHRRYPDRPPGGRAEQGRAARRLAAQADVKVTVDHPDHVPRSSQAAQRAGRHDRRSGRRRSWDEACGVRLAEAAVALARQVSATPGLRFDGLMGYEGHTLMIDDPAAKRAAIGEAIGRLLDARARRRRRDSPAGSSRPAERARTSTPPISPASPRSRPAAGSSPAITTRRSVT